MFCHKCKNKLDLPNKKVGFKEVCQYCSSDLHVCKNCKFYCVGKPNDCSVLNTEFVEDKEKFNYCEEFFFKDDIEEKNNKSAKDVSSKLFKDSNNALEKKSFKDLFKD